ncbi:hypothetical protein J2I47_05255 [Fibrella sp. HMF5335]|uniref:Uncharacterized protein n=1 Tax=Fibrella rubiginis TaxID=2817060 RepID=A0A939GFU6_9BACT|nr:hypothetical protein [Fibrella rubiginis]MBO0935946.1 hypothetical protein [Fibrella rubiginis]
MISQQPTQPVFPRATATHRPWLGWLYALVFTALPIGAVAWAWWCGAANVPKWDDHALKESLLQLEKATSPLGWFRQVIAQHNEHRIALDRLLAWADFTLSGKLSFTRLMVYGDMSLLFLVALFGVVLARYTKAWYVFLPPVAFFIISLAQWENLYWALSSIQNFGVVFWSLACLYALAHQPKPWLAIGLAAGATLVSGNGFLVWPIGVLMLLVQRRNRDLLPWGIAAMGLIALYFWHYAMPKTHPPTRGNVVELAGACLAFLGAAIEALPTTQPYLLSMLLGGGLLLGWGVELVRFAGQGRHKTSWKPLQTFGFGALAFLVGTAMVVVWGRFGYGKDMLLTSRYRIYSLTLLSLTYTYWLSIRYNKEAFSAKMVWTYALGGLVLSGILWWSAFRLNTHEVIALRKQLLTSQYNWTYTRNAPTSGIDSTTARLIDNAPAFYDATLPRFFKPVTAAIFPVDTLFKAGDNYILRLGVAPTSPPVMPSLTHPDAGLNVLLRSAKRTYLYGVLPRPYRNWRVLVGLLPLYPNGQPIEVAIPGGELDAGTYDLAVVQYGLQASTGMLRPTNRLLTVAPHHTITGPVKNW